MRAPRARVSRDRGASGDRRARRGRGRRRRIRRPGRGEPRQRPLPCPALASRDHDATWKPLPKEHSKRGAKAGSRRDRLVRRRKPREGGTAWRFSSAHKLADGWQRGAPSPHEGPRCPTPSHLRQKLPSYGSMQIRPELSGPQISNGSPLLCPSRTDTVPRSGFPAPFVMVIVYQCSPGFRK